MRGELTMVMFRIGLFLMGAALFGFLFLSIVGG